jgi:hypothetical protein
LAIADGVFAVPADALQDDERDESAKLEGGHSRSRSGRGLGEPMQQCRSWSLITFSLYSFMVDGGISLSAIKIMVGIMTTSSK